MTNNPPGAVLAAVSCYHDVDTVMKELARLFPASTPIILTSAASGCCVDGIWLRGSSVKAQDGDGNGSGAEETRGATTKPEIAHHTKFHVRTYVEHGHAHAHTHTHPITQPHTRARAQSESVKCRAIKKWECTLRFKDSTTLTECSLHSSWSKYAYVGG